MNSAAAFSDAVSLGLDPLPDTVTAHDLSTLAASLRSRLDGELASTGAAASPSAESDKAATAN